MHAIGSLTAWLDCVKGRENFVLLALYLYEVFTAFARGKSPQGDSYERAGWRVLLVECFSEGSVARTTVLALSALILIACGGQIQGTSAMDGALRPFAEHVAVHCLEGYDYNGTSGKCEPHDCSSTCRNELPPGVSCAGGFVYSKALHRCAKPECSALQSWNGSLGRCVCIPAPWEFWNGTHCVPRCNYRKHLYWNEVTEKCACKRGYVYSNAQSKCITILDAAYDNVNAAADDLKAAIEALAEEGGEIPFICKPEAMSGRVCNCPNGLFGKDGCIEGTDHLGGKEKDALDLK